MFVSFSKLEYLYTELRKDCLLFVLKDTKFWQTDLLVPTPDLPLEKVYMTFFFFLFCLFYYYYFIITITIIILLLY